MTTIFFNNKPIILTSKIHFEKHHKNYLLSTVSINRILEDLSSKSISKAYLVGSKDEDLLASFSKKLPQVIAGGGMVKNKQGEILFIYRNHKWDLPKGKAEKNETIQQTALREVEEETGAQGLKITGPLKTTYHIFNRNQVNQLKITHWFQMETTQKNALLPQVNEGITVASWKSPREVREALQNSYANIKQLFI